MFGDGLWTTPASPLESLLAGNPNPGKVDQALVAPLEHLEAEVWSGVWNGGAINEGKRFAAMVVEFANT